jgi:hypothetical protein
MRKRLRSHDEEEKVVERRKGKKETSASVTNTPQKRRGRPKLS